VINSRARKSSAIICLPKPIISVKKVIDDIKRKTAKKALLWPKFFCQNWNRASGTIEKIIGYIIFRTYNGFMFSILEYIVGRIVRLAIEFSLPCNCSWKRVEFQ